MTKWVTPYAHAIFQIYFIIRISTLPLLLILTRFIIILDLTTSRVNPHSDFPKWIARGSTWINQNGFLIDMANLPPFTCRKECDWWLALRSWYDAHAAFLTEDEVNKAHDAWQLKEKSCEYCKRRRWFGFSRMKKLANDRKRRASMPEKWKKLNKFTRKMYYIEVDWDLDWFYTQ